MLPADLPEALNIGRRTREVIVGTKSCPALTLYGIVLTGVSHTDDSFCFIRHRPHMAQLLVGLEGKGEVTIDGEWRQCEPGNAYLTPPIVPHGYRSLAGTTSESGATWVVCWVMYSTEAQDVRHGASSRLALDIGVDEPSLVPADGSSLRNAIENLYRESMGAAQPTVLQSWAALVHSYAQRVISPQPRLMPIWKAVGADLAFPWTLTDLSDIVGVTPEQVRRLCQRELGCSPMHHVTEIRMRAAASLLASDFYTVEAVAERIGYENAFAFSTAFKRRMGMTPSDFRRHTPSVASTATDE